jgi:hypothetical protein
MLFTARSPSSLRPRKLPSKITKRSPALSRRHSPLGQDVSGLPRLGLKEGGRVEIRSGGCQLHPLSRHPPSHNQIQRQDPLDALQAVRLQRLDGAQPSLTSQNTGSISYRARYQSINSVLVSSVSVVRLVNSPQSIDLTRGAH